MDDPVIGGLCKSLALFCNHLQNSSDALKQSVERRPIPLDSASSTFVQCLNRRVASTTTDLNLLESMSFGTVSFEELLGHCSELYKKNQADLTELEDCFSRVGFVSEPEMHEEDETSEDPSAPIESELKTAGADALLEDSLSLKDLGLSDVCLATIASEANSEIYNSDVSLPEPMKRKENEMKKQYGPGSQLFEANGGDVEDEQKSVGAPHCIINLTMDDYESLPSYMKTLATWEDLLAAVEKMNSILSQKGQEEGGSLFHQDELASLGLGSKGRSYVLLLLRLNRLVVETVDGLIFYRVL
ncbi:uncharacterized protein LOC127806707 isoform X2 [Diospyros lotus]|uniref:uncharacterized protein LOC127806707 isoform X2 n=1 Tax=Diospyros lotus TaxID=55363 RepID=UPI00225726D5|nr:uncharacterized protein LOC127806707 isoform X2 [Diospyros lotus]